MIAIRIRFPGHRYHATPWDRHVNEGQVEWPPSPWRLLRALIATWHLKAHEEVAEADMRAIAAALAQAPAYRLPTATLAHTRHYLPTRDKTTKVFDSFVHVSAHDDTLWVLWPTAALTPSARSALSLLLARLGYLGRAESWVDAALGDDPPADGRWLRPFECGFEAPVSGERIDLLTPLDPEAFALWRTQAAADFQLRRLAETREAELAKGKAVLSEKLGKKELAAIEGRLPRDPFEALQIDTGSLRKAGWSMPPGTRWVAYFRPADAFKPTRRRSRPAQQVTYAQYALSGAARPKLRDAVVVCDALRRALMGRDGPHRPDGIPSPLFSGKDAHGVPLRGHVHAYYVAEALDPRRRGDVTHLTVALRVGAFDEQAQRSLVGLRELRGRDLDRHGADADGGAPFQLVLLSYGTAPEEEAHMRQSGNSQVLQSACRWRSQTPYVMPRHPKTRGGIEVDSPAQQVRRELEDLGLGEDVVAIDVLPMDGAAAFRLKRPRGNGARALHRGFEIQVAFSRPVRGPLALGYGAHYGLGLFVPADATSGFTEPAAEGVLKGSRP